VAGKYDVGIQETSLLNLAYKGLYLMQAMGQFSKDNAFRDDISTRMAYLGNKLDLENPSEVNQGIMDSLGVLAMNKDGEFVDDLIIKPYYEATKTYFDAIQPITKRKEKFSEDFFLTQDKLLAAKERATQGFYEGSEASEALTKTERGFMKNVNAIGINQRAIYNESLQTSRDQLNVINFLEKSDMDKDLKGVQLNAQSLGEDYNFEGKSLQDIFDKAAFLVESQNYEAANEVLGDIAYRDKKRNESIKNQISEIKPYEASLIQVQETILKGNPDMLNNKMIKNLLTHNVKLSETYMGDESMKNPESIKKLYEDKLSALGSVLEDVGTDDITVDDLLNNPTKLQEFLKDIRGGSITNWQHTNDGDGLANVVQKTIEYMKQLNKSSNTLFGNYLIEPSGVTGVAYGAGIDF
jgi:hypothetical protein